MISRRAALDGAAVLAAMDRETDVRAADLAARCRAAARYPYEKRKMAMLLLEIAKDYEYLAAQDAGKCKRAA